MADLLKTNWKPGEAGISGGVNAIAAKVNELAAGGGGSSDPASLNAHIHSDTPHPVYDDLPSLRLIFENGLI